MRHRRLSLFTKDAGDVVAAGAALPLIGRTELTVAGELMPVQRCAEMGAIAIAAGRTLT